MATEHFTVQLLLEHSKAGRVVGPKGTMIQALKVADIYIYTNMHSNIYIHSHI